MNVANRSAFFVGDWQVSPPQGTLRRGDEVVRLELKAMEVLVYLVRPGQLRKELKVDYVLEGGVRRTPPSSRVRIRSDRSCYPR